MVGITFSHYKILEKLGEGGMGIVYKAQDTKLNRTVALKFLPEHIASSEKDAARFMQEAQAAASLNHPNICTIHGIEETDDEHPSTTAPLAPSLGVKKHFIVMEFVEGQTLQEKKSSLSMKQALDIGIQVAEGLAAAHEKGIVHRDIKPENVMIRRDGRVQVMDFGLAKLRGASRLTREGSTVGTAGYMSPEQVQGQETDHRSDIFSLGVLLYEMFTGQLPFKGVHETAIAYEIVNVDSPPMSSLKPEIQPELDDIVLECLEKDPKERTQSVSQVAVDLKRYRRESSRSRASRIMTRTTGSRASATVSSGSSSQVDVSVHLDLARIYQIVAFVGLVLATVFFILWAPWSNGNANSHTVTRTTVKLPETYELNFSWGGSTVATSPDGTTIAYVAFSYDSATSKIYVRSLDSFESKPLVNTGGSMIKFSPDGQSIVFADNGNLQKVSINGGSPVKIAKVGSLTGMSWGPDGDLYFVKSAAEGVSRLRPGRDSAETVATPDTSRQEISFRYPDVLPDGKAMLLTVKSLSMETFDDATIDLLEISTGKRKNLISGGSAARYVPTGHIVYVRGGSFFAVPFDAGSGEITGPTKELFAGGQLMLESGAAVFDLAKNGTLVYAPGGPAPTQMQTVEWLTLKNERIPIITSPRAYSFARLSPDGSKIALQINAANNDIWVYDISRRFLQRLTFAGGNNGSPIWSPDGKRIIYNNDQLTWSQVFSAPANGSGFPERLLGEKGVNIHHTEFSPDGKYLLYYQERNGKAEIWALPMAQPRAPFPVLQKPFRIVGPAISPNGKWMLYRSNETGKFVSYGMPFPKGEGKWQISPGESFGSWWSRDGREIYYLDDSFRLYAVPVQSGESLEVGTPRLLTTIAQENRTDIFGGDFDPVSMRWLFVKAPNMHFPREINVITGWFGELQKNQ